MEFSDILSAVLTPVALISGLGLLLLSQVNRFNQALFRLRDFLNRSATEELEVQIDILYRRCRTLQWSIGSMVTGLLLIALLIFFQALGAAGLHDLDWLQLYVLLGIFLAVLLSLVFFLLDVRFSLDAIRSEMESRGDGE